MGFASGMWLDSNEGTEYGTLIANGASFKEAFFTAAYHHQNGTLDEKIIARVMGAKKSENDTYKSYSADPDPFLQHPEEYAYWDKVVNNP
jgi:hypothetical protein